MYGYEEYLDITPDQVLQKVTQEQIFEWLLDKPVNIFDKYYAPYREDRNPRCWFEYKDDILLFMDFSPKTLKSHKTCFGLVIEIYDVNLVEALELICDHFNISKSKRNYQLPKKIYNPEFQEKVATIIKPILQDYNKKDREYWSYSLITLNNLQEDNVHSVKRFYLESKRGKRWITPYSHCYDINFLDAHKIYQPYRPKEYKWISNCNEDHIGNINNLPSTGDILYIQKAYDDHRVLRNLFNLSNVVWFQNEGCVPSRFILENLLSRFTNIIIMFDNDESGVAASYKLTQVFNSIRANSTRFILTPIPQYKNISDVVRKEGRKDTIKIFKNIIL